DLEKEHKKLEEDNHALSALKEDARKVVKQMESYVAAAGIEGHPPLADREVVALHRAVNFLSGIGIGFTVRLPSLPPQSVEQVMEEMAAERAAIR
ncbi:unnamed protein product, partial [Symbiodinium sp. KB8]